MAFTRTVRSFRSTLGFVATLAAPAIARADEPTPPAPIHIEAPSKVVIMERRSKDEHFEVRCTGSCDVEAGGSPSREVIAVVGNKTLPVDTRAENAGARFVVTDPRPYNHRGSIAVGVGIVGTGLAIMTVGAGIALFKDWRLCGASSCFGYGDSSEPSNTSSGYSYGSGVSATESYNRRRTEAVREGAMIMAGGAVFATFSLAVLIPLFESPRITKERPRRRAKREKAPPPSSTPTLQVGPFGKAGRGTMERGPSVAGVGAVMPLLSGTW